MRYVFIFETGEVGVSDTEPTDTDLAMIGDGILQVLKVDGSVCDLDHRGEDAALSIADLCDEVSGEPYHRL